MSDVSDLLETLIGLGVGQEITGGIDSARDPHIPSFRDLPQVIVNPLKFHNLPMNEKVARPALPETCADGPIKPVRLTSSTK
jgi:hypothetical protein